MVFKLQQDKVMVQFSSQFIKNMNEIIPVFFKPEKNSIEAL